MLQRITSRIDLRVPKYDATFACASGALKPVATLWLHYGNNASASSIGQLPEARKIVETPYYFDAYSREPRYYQRIAIDRTVEAVAKGQKRILLVMATGTGKTFTSFQIIHRLTKSGAMKLEKLAYMLNY